MGKQIGRCSLLLTVLAALLWQPAPPAMAQGATRVRERYAKQEVMVPMRDGVKLFTSIYVPKDTNERYPIILLRTPYSVGPYGPDAYRGSVGPSPQFTDEGYIVAYQDVRGRYMSEGTYVNIRPHKPAKSGPKDIDESTDTYDTIDWLVKNIPNNNGRVGMWGISYPGFYVSVGMIDSHPALKAASPQAPVGDWFMGDDFHHNGAFFLYDAFSFYTRFGDPRPAPTTMGVPGFDYGTSDAYYFYRELGPLPNANERHLKGKITFWNDLMAHPNYDSFWQERNVPKNLKNIKAAVMTVGGWFDAEDLYGPLKTYAAVEKQNAGISNTLVMGPWSHGGWNSPDGSRLGDIDFGSRTAGTYQSDVEFPFFNFHLKNKGMPKAAEAFVFETGRNQWHSLDAWPPRGAQRQRLYLQSTGGATFTAPEGRDRDAFDEYLSDPANPVPYTRAINLNRGVRYMIEDQRFAATRPDVLVYQTEALKEPLSLAGPIQANLQVSTTGTDADFVVKVIDVHPQWAPGVTPGEGLPMGGYQMLVRGEVMRARFRESFERPSAMKSGAITSVKFELQDVCHTFLPGHRLMIQVQSSWFPLVDRNPQKFVDIYQAKASDFQKATHRVYRSSSHPSFLEVGVWKP